ncbi:hypothetical protein GCM10009844_23370 [Nocardioides koreensis]|uniref:Uncharacterized protein n=1 Tax=Nocardioides koreensis TaxID=433651 RepID=A0ABN2ZSH8_9ACTN
MSSLMPRLDRVTRTFWRTTGRPVDLAGDEAWLTAPMHDGQTIGDGWLGAAATALGGTVREHDGAGLVPDMAELDGATFRAADLRPEVRHFYEHTSAWRMEVWTQWNPLFAPGGELVSRLFGRRVQQLALPTRPLDVALGMDSRVVTLLDADGRQRAAGWIRTLRSTGEYVYSGCYSSRTLPGSDQPSVHVAFPLEAGNVQVLLRPRARPDGSLVLSSPPGAFGEDGAYVLVADRDRHHAARAPIHEEFHVYVDPDGVLRTDHVLRLWSATAVRLHYKLTQAP